METLLEHMDNKYGTNTVSTTDDEYDDLDRLYKRTRNFGNNTNIETYTYVPRTANGAGTTYLPVSLAQSVDSTLNETFSYDKNGNITKIVRDGKNIEYKYDNFNRLIRENNPILGKTYTYEYNKGGNIISKREYDYTAGTLNTRATTHSYTYDGTYKDLLIAYDGETITYDEMARPTSYRGNNLAWRFGNLLEYGDASFDYLYDHTRVSKTARGTTTYYDYHEGRLLGEHRSGTGGTKDITYLYDHSGIFGFTLDGVAYRYVKNMQGDIVALYRDNQFIAEYVYDAWGNCTITSDKYGIGAINPIRYRGYYYDVETGLYYLMSRYYDPATGRFISPDDVSYLNPETLQGLNLFAYCGNNPVMGIDPEGTWSWKGFWNVVAAIAIVAAVAVVTAITAGAAAVAIAGSMGATAVATAAVGFTVGGTALVSGLAVGTGEIINQSINKGFDDINLGSIAISTFGGATDGALIAGSLFTGPGGKTALIAGRVGASVLTTALYGVAEGYDGETIGKKIGINASITAGAGLITYFPINSVGAAILAKPIKTGAIKAGIQAGKLLVKLLFMLIELFK